MERAVRWGLAAGLAAASLLATGVAEARWRGGGGVYFGIVPPVYVAPPAYVAPYPYPPYHAPPYYAAPAASGGCYAGPYVCPLDGPAQVGMPCACPTAQGQAWGRAR